MTATTDDKYEVSRQITVRQRPVYLMTGMLIVLLVFAVLLSGLWLFGPPIDQISGRKAWQLKMLLYGLPVIWLVVIGGGIFFGRSFRKYPRTIQVDDHMVTFHRRDGSQKILDATKVTEIKQDKYNNVQIRTSNPDETFSIPATALNSEDRDWISKYLSLTCSYLESKGRPVKVS